MGVIIGVLVIVCFMVVSTFVGIITSDWSNIVKVITFLLFAAAVVYIIYRGLN